MVHRTTTAKVNLLFRGAADLSSGYFRRSAANALRATHLSRFGPLGALGQPVQVLGWTACVVGCDP